MSRKRRIGKAGYRNTRVCGGIPSTISLARHSLGASIASLTLKSSRVTKHTRSGGGATVSRDRRSVGAGYRIAGKGNIAPNTSSKTPDLIGTNEARGALGVTSVAGNPGRVTGDSIGGGNGRVSRNDRGRASVRGARVGCSLPGTVGLALNRLGPRVTLLAEEIDPITEDSNRSRSRRG